VCFRQSEIRLVEGPLTKKQLADNLLKQISTAVLQSLARPQDSNKDDINLVIRRLAENYAVIPPIPLNEDGKRAFDWAVRQRFSAMEQEVPAEVNSVLQLLWISNDAQSLVKSLHHNGNRSTASIEAAEELLTSGGVDKLSEAEVANALLYIAFTSDFYHHNASNFTSAVRSKSSRRHFVWQLVIENLDQEGYHVTQEHFLCLYRALLPITSEEKDLDVQGLWGGKWQQAETQLSFLKAFLFSSTDSFAFWQAPHYRPAYALDLFDGASQQVLTQARIGLMNQYSSLQAVRAIFDLALIPDDASISVADRDDIIGHLIQNNLAVFVVSALSIPQPWTNSQTLFLFKCFRVFMMKQNEDYPFALEGAWRQSPEWVFQQLHQLFVLDPMTTNEIFDLAREFGWMDYMLKFIVPLSLDLACRLHRESKLDIEQWVKKKGEGHPTEHVAATLKRFLQIKAEDETRVQRRDQPGPTSVTMAVKTVFALLLTLEDFVSDPEILTPIQQKCVATYPRLINYGEGFDDIIDRNSENGNGLSEEIDRQMQELLGKMYREELSFREVLELMRRYKTSQDPAEQDLFTCIVHGLFDEYNCYHEYPPEALMKTAVMFGGIINFRLISGIPLKVGLGLILEAVRSSQADEPMYKFGVEALEQLTGRLPEWAGVCNILIQIPTLRCTTIYRKAEEVLRDRGHDFDPESDLNGVNGMPDALALTNGNLDDLLTPDMSAHNFRALHADPTMSRYVEPEESAQEAISFVLNNISPDNLEEKLEAVEDALKEEYYIWFARQLVDHRAKTQPNYQHLYLEIVEKLEKQKLMSEVLRTTYACAIKLLNAESTVNSSLERTHLKNIGSWLGLLTIAKDKPVKHKNIYFRDLLLEAFDTQRLVVAIPFTCKVLTQGANSTVFKPPNPWLMDIIALLMELYHFADLKLNLKFEIEVLCKELKMDPKTLSPSTMVRDRPLQMEEDLAAAPSIPDGLDMFEDLSLASINRAVRNERLSPTAILSSLPQLEKRIKYPPSQEPEAVRTIVNEAFTQAVEEIIAPVVERSITIASISTAQLIQKDFASELDDEKIRSAAGQMVKALAGSLALVTCKEPLRMSISNYIRRPRADVSDQGLSEGLTIMCVNDNLDMACAFVEQAAEERSVAEIERFLEPDLEERRRHKATRPNEAFVARNLSRWSMFIPEPYRQGSQGLNEAQQEVYESFGRQPRASIANHMQTGSADSTGRQLPDVLQEPFPTIPNLSTPAEQPAVPHTSQNQAESRMHPPVMPATGPQPHINGFTDTVSPQEKIQNLMEEMQMAARSGSAESVKDLSPENSSLSSFHQVFQTLTSSARPNGEVLTRFVAEKICTTLYSDVESTLEIEIMALMLAKICQLSDLVSRDVFRWMTNQEETNITNVPVTVALVKAGLMEFSRIDTILTKAILQNSEHALTLLSELLDQLLFTNEPIALRADFSCSLEAMNQWLAEDPNLVVASEINRKLRETGVPGPINVATSDEASTKQDQLEYVFSEWVRVYQNSGASDRTYAAFLKDMHQKQVINNQGDSGAFFRSCIDICVATFEQEALSPTGSLSDAYLHTDALAKMIILLVKLQGEANGAVKIKKGAYLNSILSVAVLVQNHHQVMRGDRFNQRVFFRFFSSLLCEYSLNNLHVTTEHKDMMLVIAEIFLALQPAHFPGFTYAWINLVSHRVFMPALLNMSEEAGWESYCRIVQTMLQYIGAQLKPAGFTAITQDLYRGVLRILLILHHDFPEFVTENHFRLCNLIPAHCTQLRNLVLSAYPSSFQELPDPFTSGLRVDRLEEMKKSPVIAGNVTAALEEAGVDEVIAGVLRHGGDVDSAVSKICDVISNPVNRHAGADLTPINVDVLAMNALVLHVGQEALSASSARFDPSSPHFQLLSKLAKAFTSEARYHFFNAMANQLRYPNSHTNYFCNALLHIFGVERVDQQDSDVRQQIVRVIVERLIVNRPHPWGMLITLLELDRNTAYKFWELPFIAASPEVRTTIERLLKGSH
jgi:CCR4-NOT transcription complex subunit 1